MFVSMVYSKFCFVPMFLWEQRINGFFHNFFNVDPCAVANLLDVSRGFKFGCSILISFHVGILMIIDSAPESIKNSISRSDG